MHLYMILSSPEIIIRPLPFGCPKGKKNLISKIQLNLFFYEILPENHIWAYLPCTEEDLLINGSTRLHRLHGQCWVLTTLSEASAFPENCVVCNASESIRTAKQLEIKNDSNLWIHPAPTVGVVVVVLHPTISCGDR